MDGDIAVLQSLAILRHVGRKLGLYGKSNADAARIDSLLDGLEDMRNKTRALVCELTPHCSCPAQCLPVVLALLQSTLGQPELPRHGCRVTHRGVVLDCFTQMALSYRTKDSSST
eukprot:COSAG02_NODE_49_length_45106_cov_298.436177_36_plen_115_part_00